MDKFLNPFPYYFYNIDSYKINKQGDLIKVIFNQIQPSKLNCTKEKNFKSNFIANHINAYFDVPLTSIHYNHFSHKL